MHLVLFRAFITAVLHTVPETKSLFYQIQVYNSVWNMGASNEGWVSIDDFGPIPLHLLLPSSLTPIQMNAC